MSGRPSRASSMASRARSTRRPSPRRLSGRSSPVAWPPSWLRAGTSSRRSSPRSSVRSAMPATCPSRSWTGRAGCAAMRRARPSQAARCHAPGRTAWTWTRWWPPATASSSSATRTTGRATRRTLPATARSSRKTPSCRSPSARWSPTAPHPSRSSTHGVRAGPGVAWVEYYHYGLMRLENLRWAGDAVTRSRKRAVGRGRTHRIARPRPPRSIPALQGLDRAGQRTDARRARRGRCARPCRAGPRGAPRGASRTLRRSRRAGWAAPRRAAARGGASAGGPGSAVRSRHEDVAPVDQEAHVALDALEHRDRQVRLAQGGAGHRERVDGVALARLAGRPAGPGHVLGRHAPDPLAREQQVALEAAAESAGSPPARTSAPASAPPSAGPRGSDIGCRVDRAGAPRRL